MTATPQYGHALAQGYGPPSDAAFGSAVFFQPALPELPELEDAALEAYRRFMGEQWSEREAVWTSVWACCHERPEGGPADAVGELKSLTAVNDRSSAEMLLDLEGGATALKAGFDDPATSRFAVYRLGDGEALSGILLAGARTEGVTSLVFLMD